MTMKRKTSKIVSRGLSAFMIASFVSVPLTTLAATTNNEELPTPIISEEDKTTRDILDSFNSSFKKDGDLIRISIEDDMYNTGDFIDKVIVKGKGVFAVKDNKEYQLTNIEFDVDFNAMRVLRYDKGKMLPVMYQADDNSITITSNNFKSLEVSEKLQNPFKDVDNSNPYRQSITDIFNYGISTGTTASTFSPYNIVTRGQFTVMVSNALGVLNTDYYGDYTLTDLNGKWYANNVQSLFDLNIVAGYGGKFNGNETINRQQVVAIITRMLNQLGVDTTTDYNPNFVDDDYLYPYAKQSAYYLVERGIVSTSNNEFQPYESLTRGETADILVKSLKLSEQY